MGTTISTACLCSLEVCSSTNMILLVERNLLRKSVISPTFLSSIAIPLIITALEILNGELLFFFQQYPTFLETNLHQRVQFRTVTNVTPPDPLFGYKTLDLCLALFK